VPQLEAILNKKRISFFVAETYPSFAGGGRNAFSMARFLGRKGALVKMACLNYNKGLLQKEVKDGVLINRISYFNKNLLVKLFSTPNLLFQYSRLILQSDIIFIYGCYMPGYLWIILFSRLFKKCLVFRSTLLGDDDMASLSQKPFWIIRKKIFNMIGLYFAINEDFKNIWLQHMKTQVPVFMSQQGVDSYIFNPNVRQRIQNVPKKVPIILSNAILIERKGYRHIFKALEKVKSDFRFVVIGQYLSDEYHRSTDKELKEMKELHALGIKMLGDRIEFISTTENILPYLSQSDLFLYGGILDGTPNAVLEAMAVQLPVLMYDAGVNKDIFSPGRTVEMLDNFEELPQKIDAILADLSKMEIIAENAATTISKKYTFEKVVTRLFSALPCKNLNIY
jgi:glycosyltransferase involved in cell wall biosynthesis